jgi:SAM-dependent methyltransferase
VFVNSESNSYSHRWFESFHVGISDARTIPEVDFISSFAPLPQFRTVADICCGMGRHARALSERGYAVTGVDRDFSILAKAREQGCGPRYLQADLRDYQPELAAYDVVIVMGQSFGHFDAETNRTVLGRLAAGVRERGRLILDLWNSDFFASHQGERDLKLPDGIVHETKRVQDGRLFVHLSYSSGEQEDFEWQLFTSTDMEAVAAPLGLTLIACCTDFDCSAGPRASKPRIQFVMERCG